MVEVQLAEHQVHATPSDELPKIDGDAPIGLSAEEWVVLQNMRLQKSPTGGDDNQLQAGSQPLQMQQQQTNINKCNEKEKTVNPYRSAFSFKFVLVCVLRVIICSMIFSNKRCH